MGRVAEALPHRCVCGVSVSEMSSGHGPRAHVHPGTSQPIRLPPTSPSPISSSTHPARTAQSGSSLSRHASAGSSAVLFGQAFAHPGGPPLHTLDAGPRRPTKTASAPRSTTPSAAVEPRRPRTGSLERGVEHQSVALVVLGDSAPLVRVVVGGGGDLARRPPRPHGRRRRRRRSSDPRQPTRGSGGRPGSPAAPSPSPRPRRRSAHHRGTSSSS